MRIWVETWGSGKVAARSMIKSFFKYRMEISLASITSSPFPKTLELGAMKPVLNLMIMLKRYKRSAIDLKTVMKTPILESEAKHAGPPHIREEEVKRVYEQCHNANDQEHMVPIGNKVAAGVQYLVPP